VQQQAKEKKRSTDVCKAAAVDFGVQSDKRKDRAKCCCCLSPKQQHKEQQQQPHKILYNSIHTKRNTHIYISKASKANSKVPEKSNDL
jgi:hypothetical protein